MWYIVLEYTTGDLLWHVIPFVVQERVLMCKLRKKDLIAWLLRWKKLTKKTTTRKAGNWLTLPAPEKLKNPSFAIPVIPNLNINNQRITSTKAINLDNQRITSTKAINLDIIRKFIKYSLKTRWCLLSHILRYCCSKTGREEVNTMTDRKALKQIITQCSSREERLNQWCNYLLRKCPKYQNTVTRQILLRN